VHEWLLEAIQKLLQAALAADVTELVGRGSCWLLWGPWRCGSRGRGAAKLWAVASGRCWGWPDEVPAA